MEGRLKIAFFLLLLFPWGALASETHTPSIVGRWGYFMKVFDGHEMPEPPDATLRLRYEFSAEGRSRLYWWHEGDSDFCERRGSFRLEGGMLVDKVEWVNPENSFGCGEDPDMQNGKTTRTPVYFQHGNLIMRLHLGEEDLLYVWKKLKEGEK